MAGGSATHASRPTPILLFPPSTNGRVRLNSGNGRPRQALDEPAQTKYAADLIITPVAVTTAPQARVHALIRASAARSASAGPVTRKVVQSDIGTAPTLR